MSVRDDATEARCPVCEGWVCLGDTGSYEIVQGEPTHTECAGKLDPDPEPVKPYRQGDAQRFFRRIFPDSPVVHERPFESTRAGRRMLDRSHEGY